MRVVINSNFPLNAFADDEIRNEGLFDNVVILSQTTQRNVHILIRLREDVNGALVMTVVLIPVDSLRWERLEVTVVVKILLDICFYAPEPDRSGWE